MGVVAAVGCAWACAAGCCCAASWVRRPDKSSPLLVSAGFVAPGVADGVLGFAVPVPVDLPGVPAGAGVPVTVPVEGLWLPGEVVPGAGAPEPGTGVPSAECPRLSSPIPITAARMDYDAAVAAGSHTVEDLDVLRALADEADVVIAELSRLAPSEPWSRRLRPCSPPGGRTSPRSQVQAVLLVPMHMHYGVHRRNGSPGVSASVQTGPMPSSEDRDRRAADLRERAALRRDGWEPYQSVWSSGEVAGVRAVLGEPGALDTAVELWAPTLWGAGPAEADARTGYRSTRKWFAAVEPNDAMEMTDAEKASLAASRAAIGDLAHAIVEGADPDEAEAALEAARQASTQLDLNTLRDKIHVPEDAGEYEDGLRRIMMRIPPNWDGGSAAAGAGTRSSSSSIRRSSRSTLTTRCTR